MANQTATLGRGPMHDLVAFRHDLHCHPELSGQESATSRRVAAFVAQAGPSRIIPGLGGHGLACVFESGQPGPTVMFRAELDALPIPEQGRLPWKSVWHGLAHACGHDGHMACLAGLAFSLKDQPLAFGRVVLLFQPAEETGEGARAVLADPRFADIRPDWAFALHNMPGLPLGHVAVAAGPVACASVGLHVVLQGREAHAAQPETGVSPVPVVQAMLDWLQPYAQSLPGSDLRLATLCHLQLGHAAFGVAPGQAELRVTLRSASDSGLELLETAFRDRLAELAAGIGLGLTITRHDHFSATINHPKAAAIVRNAISYLDIPVADFGFPMRPSEDFGAFSDICPVAFFLVGAGQDRPDLHNPDYDFPDGLIAPTVALWREILDQTLAVARA